MAEVLTPKHFLPLVDKVFRVRGGRHALTLVAVEVAEPAPESEPPRQSFNLIFSGPPGDVLRQGLYTLEVADGPHFELYVIPIYTPNPARQDYQSVFN
jgi:hypothetical protein